MIDEGIKKLLKKNVNWVDLGLPSGTKWADCNVGSDLPEEVGSLFPYNACSEYVFPVQISRQQKAVLPSLEQYKELVNNCKWTLTKLNDVLCLKLVGPNGNEIFFPATGFGLSNSIEENEKRMIANMGEAADGDCHFYELHKNASGKKLAYDAILDNGLKFSMTLPEMPVSETDMSQYWCVLDSCGDEEFEDCEDCDATTVEATRVCHEPKPAADEQPAKFNLAENIINDCI